MYEPKKWVRFSVAEEVLYDVPGWEGFSALDTCIRKFCPGYEGAELMVLEDNQGFFYPRFTFHVW